MGNFNYSKNYLEWCEIMKQSPNTREAIIFDAGYTWACLNKAEQQQEEMEEEINDIETRIALKSIANEGEELYICPDNGRLECVPNCPRGSPHPYSDKFCAPVYCKHSLQEDKEVECILYKGVIE